jgi:hypothetical protein
VRIEEAHAATGEVGSSVRALAGTRALAYRHKSAGPEDEA